MKIKIAKLRSQITSTFEKNFSAKDSAAIADYLIWAEMVGMRTQGIIKLTGTEPIQNIKPKGKIIIEKRTKISENMNANANPSILVATIAAEKAIKKAKQNGIGVIGTRNYFSSNGAQAYYVEKMAKAGFIGIMCSRVPASTVAFGSADPLFGTNPIGFAFPTAKEPIVFDMATSAMTWYGLVLAKARGENIPANMAIDALGNPTTNPAEAMKGGLLPFDRSYKGAGLGMVVELLAGPLVGAGYIDNKTFKEEWGSIVIAIDPGLLVDRKKFKTSCSDMIKKIKSARKRKGVKEIRLPGERMRESYEKARKSGIVEVDDVVMRQLKYRDTQ